MNLLKTRLPRAIIQYNHVASIKRRSQDHAKFGSHSNTRVDGTVAGSQSFQCGTFTNVYIDGAIFLSTHKQNRLLHPNVSVLFSPTYAVLSNVLSQVPEHYHPLLTHHYNRFLTAYLVLLTTLGRAVWQKINHWHLKFSEFIWSHWPTFCSSSLSDLLHVSG